MCNDDSKVESWMGPREWVLERIMSETGFDAVEAEVVARGLETIHPTLRPELLQWWRTQDIDLDQKVYGWSLRRLVDEWRPDHVCTAFTWLSGLVDEATRDETLAMLGRGFTGIIVAPEVAEKLIKDRSH